LKYVELKKGAASRVLKAVGFQLAEVGGKALQGGIRALLEIR
jgi:hypothetical protein